MPTFGQIKDSISSVSELIKKFVAILKNFIASWKKIPAAADKPEETPVA